MSQHLRHRILQIFLFSTTSDLLLPRRTFPSPPCDRDSVDNDTSSLISSDSPCDQRHRAHSNATHGPFLGALICTWHHSSRLHLNPCDVTPEVAKLADNGGPRARRFRNGGGDDRSATQLISATSACQLILLHTVGSSPLSQPPHPDRRLGCNSEPCNDCAACAGLPSPRRLLARIDQVSGLSISFLVVSATKGSPSSNPNGLPRDRLLLLSESLFPT
ncbi:hypothetical protein OBBRIDRAFT_83979 [Obba rivulosa]|uniref:Uncharacterized protein n=1 Tax=Obba rivulosa TaxID=1052685 RepID=A0A8E2AZV4_9APHY|nr:hypothetical protein OBBRIDRAFT_83979 [Obba rivulosa]